ncbi:unannotated protein [freshwater metagenome]|uniref:Unannotated protein n=1 Tax=freshwater metagenome TaxID=449393 RepID=A0A6J7ER55_9ZZZZ
MILGLFPLFLLAIIGAVVYFAVQAGRRGHPSAAPTVRADLPNDLSRWVSEGLITAEQSAAIQVGERAAAAPVMVAPLSEAPPRHRVPPVAEALGYLGGMLAIIGLLLVLSRYWTDMSVAGRLGLSGGGAVAVLIGGVLVREHTDPALARLRWFLWLIATVATGLFVGVMLRDGFDVEKGLRIALGVSAAVTVLSGLLWWWRDRPVQQFTCLAGVAVFAGVVFAQLVSTGTAGLAVWTVGALLMAAALREVTPNPVLTALIGMWALAVGALIAAASWEGPALIFAVATGLLLLAVALIPGLAPSTAYIVLAAIVGTIVTFEATVAALVYYARGAGVTTGVITWLAGASLLFVASQRMVRVPVLCEIAGGVTLIGGAALTGVQWHSVAPLFGIVTAFALIGLGMLPGRVLMSVLGSFGLLINVPWAISRYFPGEGRAPLLIMVSGALIIGVAVLLTRMSGRLRSELGGTHHRGPRHGAPPSGFTPMHS